jgi:hypothetical protein
VVGLVFFAGNALQVVQRVLEGIAISVVNMVSSRDRAVSVPPDFLV